MGDVGTEGGLETAIESRVLQGVPIALAYVDADLVYRYINPVAARIVGRPAEEIVGRPLAEVIGADSDAYRAVSRVVATAHVEQSVIEFPSHGPPETRGHYLSSYSPDMDETGRLRGILLAAIDVSETVSRERHAEETAAETMRLLRAVMDNSQAAIYVKDTEGRYMLANEAAASTFGISPDKMLGKRDVDLMPREAAERLGENDREVIVTRSRREYEETHVHDDASVTVLSVKFPILDERGTVIGVGGVSADITLRKRAEQQVEKLAEAASQRAAELDAVLRELTAVVRVTDVAVSTLDLDALLRALLEPLREVMSADAATVLTEEGGRLRAYSSVGMEEARTGFELPVGQGFAGRIAATRQPRYLADAQTTDEVVSTFLREHGIRTMLGVPLLVGDEVLGVMHVDWLEVHPQSPRELELLRVVADRAALAIRNAQLYEERRRQEALSRALTEIDAEVNSTLEFDEIMQSVVERAARAIDADASVMYLVDDSRWRLRFAWNVPSRFVGRLYERSEALYATLATRSPSLALIDNDPRSTEGYERSLPVKIGATGVLNVIIKLGDEVIASFGLFHLDENKRFTQQHLTFVRNVAASVRLALRNARLYAEERHVADTLQRALLRTPSQVEGVRFECLYQSATETARVGGDFYDLFRLEDGRVGVVIGDVSGKGLAASTLTSLVRNTLQAYAYDVDSPAVVVDKTNRVVFDAIPPEMFMTLVFGILDPPTGRMRYCNAGHPAGLLLRSDGRIDGLEPTSPLIGAFREMEFEDAETRLGEGDLLLLYTDGVIEAKGETGMFGEERLRDTLHAVSEGGDPAQLPQRVFERLLEFTGGGVADDVAMLAIALG